MFWHFWLLIIYRSHNITTTCNWIFYSTFFLFDSSVRMGILLEKGILNTHNHYFQEFQHLVFVPCWTYGMLNFNVNENGKIYFVIVVSNRVPKKVNINVYIIHQQVPLTINKQIDYLFNKFCTVSVNKCHHIFVTNLLKCTTWFYAIKDLNSCKSAFFAF